MADFKHLLDMYQSRQRPFLWLGAICFLALMVMLWLNPSPSVPPSSEASGTTGHELLSRVIEEERVSLENQLAKDSELTDQEKSSSNSAGSSEPLISETNASLKGSSAATSLQELPSSKAKSGLSDSSAQKGSSPAAASKNVSAPAAPIKSSTSPACIQANGKNGDHGANVSANPAHVQANSAVESVPKNRTSEGVKAGSSTGTTKADNSTNSAKVGSSAKADRSRQQEKQEPKNTKESSSSSEDSSDLEEPSYPILEEPWPPVPGSGHASVESTFVSRLSYMFLVLCVVCTIMWLALKFFAPLFNKMSSHATSKERLSILERKSLGPGKAVFLIEVEGQHLLLGMTEQNISTLACLSQTTSNAGVPNSTSQPPSGAFSAQPISSALPTVANSPQVQQQPESVQVDASVQAPQSIIAPPPSNDSQTMPNPNPTDTAAAPVTALRHSVAPTSAPNTAPLPNATDSVSASSAVSQPLSQSGQSPATAPSLSSSIKKILSQYISSLPVPKFHN
ncbi:MAG: flagellar biosynthetic protein FliO [bacterium]|nr:flagellar biosynthetic protein FliO [bacterium]